MIITDKFPYEEPKEVEQSETVKSIGAYTIYIDSAKDIKIQGAKLRNLSLESFQPLYAFYPTIDHQESCPFEVEKGTEIWCLGYFADKDELTDWMMCGTSRSELVPTVYYFKTLNEAQVMQLMFIQLYRNAMYHHHKLEVPQVDVAVATHVKEKSNG